MKGYEYVSGWAFLENINKLMRKIRYKHNITADMLADEMHNISPSSIYSFELGKTGIPLKKVALIFDKMGYKIVVMAVKREEEEVDRDE